MFVLAALAWLSIGCESDCEKVCEKSKECSSDDINDTWLGDVSCDDLCDLSEDVAEIAHCEDEWDDYIACTADALPDDGCAVANYDCRAESEAYNRCFGYDDDNSTSSGGSGGSGGSN